MGVLSRLLSRRPKDPPRAAERVLVAPEPTPSMRRIPQLGPTAGTRVHRAPQGTPSTERLHNPRHPGR